MSESKKKDPRGGARRKADPEKGTAVRTNIMLYHYQKEHLISKYGTLSKGIQTLIDMEITGDPHGQAS